MPEGDGLLPAAISAGAGCSLVTDLDSPPLRRRRQCHRHGLGQRLHLRPQIGGSQPVAGPGHELGHVMDGVPARLCQINLRLRLLQLGLQLLPLLSARGLKLLADCVHLCLRCLDLLIKLGIQLGQRLILRQFRVLALAGVVAGGRRLGFRSRKLKSQTHHLVRHLPVVIDHRRVIRIVGDPLQRSLLPVPVDRLVQELKNRRPIRGSLGRRALSERNGTEADAGPPPSRRSQAARKLESNDSNEF